MAESLRAIEAKCLRIESLLMLARLCDVFAQAQLGGAIRISRRLLHCGAGDALDRCFGSNWLDISGEVAVTAACLAAAIDAAGDLPPSESR